MKNLFGIVFLCIIFTALNFAQAPQSFKYQAIARDVEGNVISDQQISLRISLLQESETGTAVYSETHELQTNQFGLINLEIGMGKNKSGEISSINWETGKYFVNVEIDVNGGSDFVSMGISQLLSVPYALFAESAGSGSKQSMSWTDGASVTYLTNSGWDVGIGTSAPSSKLDVIGKGTFENVYGTKTDLTTAGGHLVSNKFEVLYEPTTTSAVKGSSMQIKAVTGDPAATDFTSFLQGLRFSLVHRNNGTVAQMIGGRFQMGMPTGTWGGTGTTGTITSLKGIDMELYGMKGTVNYGTGISLERVGANFNNLTYLRINQPTDVAGNYGIYNNSSYDNYFSGKVGIGTTAPAREFEVVGPWQTARITSDDLGSQLEFVSQQHDDWSIATWRGDMYLLSSDDDFATKTDEYGISTTSIYPYNTNTKSLGTNSKEWSSLHSVNGYFSGEVGIGTTAPARKFEVVGGWQDVRISSTTAGASLELVSQAADDWSIGVWADNLFFMSSTDDFVTKTDRYLFTTSSFYPFTGSITLGTSSKPWSNIFSVDGDFTGEINVKGHINGNQSSLGGLIIHDDASGFASMYITPKSTGSEDSSRVFLAEDHNATFGMYWLYDGNDNEMELWGKANSSNYGPHMVIERNDGDMAIGGSTIASGYQVSIHGDLICEEVRIALVADWPDYVFKKDYKLMSIPELGTFIQNNGHLPDVPPAAEIEEEGFDVGDMQKIMMQKIEELSR